MGEFVIGNYFSVLGLRPAIGRLLIPRDDQAGSTNSAVVVVSWRYWKDKSVFGQDIVGKQIVVNGLPCAVVGVTPPEFMGLQLGVLPDVWVPLAAQPLLESASANTRHISLSLLGRLKPGVSISAARAEMAVLYRWTIDERSRTSKDPLLRKLKVELEPAASGFSALRERFGRPLLMVMVVVSMLLAIACINVALMLLARNAHRQTEMAIRVSLGAGRFDLMRQVLTESLVLSVAGTLAGVVIAYFFARLLVQILTSGRQIPGFPPGLEISVPPDMHVLFFTAGAALLTGLLFGVVPAWTAFRTQPAFALRRAGRGGAPRSWQIFAKALVISQIAVAAVLLSAAWLFAGHLTSLEYLDTGFQRDHLLIVTLDSAHSGFKPEQLSHLYRELLERFKALPNVRAVSSSAATPISGAGASRFANVEDHPERPEARRYVSLNWIAPDYFRTLETPLLAGRDFTTADQNRPPVVLINRAMAHYYFGNQSPIGKHIAFDGDAKRYEIVGVVGDAKYFDLKEAFPRTIYLNAFQEQRMPSNFLLRSGGRPEALEKDVRSAVHAVFPTVPVARMTTMADQVDASIVPERMLATLAGWFGVLGSVLTAIGIYGLLAYTVARRTPEIGIRMALGATRTNVVGLVLKNTLQMFIPGLLIGLVVAFA